MPSISEKTKGRISEQILAYLFSQSPEPKYTVDVASSVARDEEFTKALLTELEKRKLVIKVTKSAQGITFTRRQRWRLSDAAFSAYKQMSKQRAMTFIDEE